LLATLAALESWLDTGVKPGASFFPESEGFDSKFVPPPWPARWGQTDPATPGLFRLPHATALYEQ
jgi:hypothetical protein